LKRRFAKGLIYSLTGCLFTIAEIYPYSSKNQHFKVISEEEINVSTKQVTEYCLRVVADGSSVMSVEAMLQNMIDELNDTLKDAAKHDKGVNAAGTRVRKTMQGIKSAAQDVRKQVQSDRS
jgi:flagellar hook-basal body complex protein FliE